MSTHFDEDKCSVCGKEFIPAPQHIYKDHSGRYVCSYHCSLESERRSEEKKAKAREQSKRKWTYKTMLRHMTKEELIDYVRSLEEKITELEARQ